MNMVTLIRKTWPEALADYLSIMRVVIGLYVCRLGSVPNGAGSMVKYVVSFFS